MPAATTPPPGLARWSAGGYRGWVVSRRRDSVAPGPLDDLLRAGFEGAVAWRSAGDREVHRLPPALFVKRYRASGWWDGLRSALGVHRSRLAWRRGLDLLGRGVPTPAPIGHLSRRVRLLPAPVFEHVLVTEDVEPGEPLDRLVARRLAPPPGTPGRASPEARRELLRGLARFVAGLHDAGVYHGDFTARNILVAGEEPRFLLVDLDALRSTRRISSRRRLKNLDELGRNVLDRRVVSTADRVRFLREYHRCCRAERRSFEVLFHAVLGRTRWRLRRERRAFTPPPARAGRGAGVAPPRAAPPGRSRPPRGA
jgi:tRNA A-37 threonylcarbamoyl transferase component Bud32